MFKSFEVSEVESGDVTRQMLYPYGWSLVSRSVPLEYLGERGEGKRRSKGDLARREERKEVWQ